MCSAHDYHDNVKTFYVKPRLCNNTEDMQMLLPAILSSIYSKGGKKKENNKGKTKKIVAIPGLMFSFVI